MKKLYLSLCLLLFTGLIQAQTVSFSLAQAPCNNDGIVNVTFAGLTTPINVSYYFANAPSINHTLAGTTDVISNYSGEDMYVIAVGANNVTAYNNFSAPPFIISVTTSPAACPAPGLAAAAVVGGAAPYTYQWVDMNQNTVGNASTASLPTGAYKLYVTDANGCSFYKDSVYVGNSTQFYVTLNTTPASCTNGTASVTAVNLTSPPYTYLWSNGATTSSVNNLVRGNYSVAVTDANGCTANGYVYVAQNPNISVNVTPTPANCTQSNGAVIAFGSGGTPPYSYLWNNNVNAQSQSGLSAGFYTVDVTDANGCTGTGYGNVSSTSPIVVTQSATPSSCTSPTGSATLSVSGGTAPYTINWLTSPAQTGATASNLAPGNYSFHVVDANGCVSNGSVHVPPVNVISANLGAVPPTCTSANGSLTVNASGGATPYSYLWNNNATTATASGLAAGYYSVVITDAAGCSATKSQHLQSTTPITLGFNTTQASCVYTADGSTTVVPAGGTSPYTYSWSNAANTAQISGVATGNYWVTVNDANGCTKSGMVNIPYNTAGNACFCTITGTVYYDVNGNCTKDPGEAGIPNIMIHCSNFGYTYTNANGVYSFKVPSGNYTISEQVLAFYPLSSCQSNGIVQNVTASSGCTQTVNFANSMNPIHDLHVSTWDVNFPIPGFSYSRINIISNDGTVAEAGIVGGMQPDNQLTAPTFNPSSVYTGSAGHYSINTGALSLAAGGATAVYTNYSVPANMPLNTSLVFKDTVAHISPVSNWLNDYSPWNNVRMANATTVGSYDPNFKDVSPRGIGANGTIYAKDSVLEYMVHFQNLGTYYAQKVVVIDTLDADLNWSTLRPIYQSHACQVSMDENGVVKFTFNNIHLPAKVQNEAGSNGMLTYTIHRKSNTPLGTQFTNRASIYFDYNEPVMTNTTINTLGVPVNVTDPGGFEDGNFTLYPNPASGMCYAQINAVKASEATLNIADVSGKVIAKQQVSLGIGVQRVAVNVEKLSPGLYFVSLHQAGRVHTEKLVILK